MAYLDALLLFSDSQALTVTAASTNNIDLTDASRNIGIGEPMQVIVDVVVAAGGTTPTLQAAVQVDTTNGFGSPISVISTPALTAAQLVVGARFSLPLPADLTGKEFMRVNYTMGGTSPTVTVTAWLAPMQLEQTEQVGAIGYTVQ